MAMDILSLIDSCIVILRINDMRMWMCSKFSLDEAIAIEYGHGIDADHALDAILALFCLVGCFFGPDEGEA